MHIRQPISVGNLLLDVGNYRNPPQNGQIEARNAIIAEQGKKLVSLAKDIIEHGMSPIDLTLVMDANDGNGSFIVIEGNRRLTTLQLLITPELAEGTDIYTAFKRLSKTYSDAVPKVLECVIVPNKRAGLVWINRKHASGLEGAGTDPWTALAKARADADQGIPRPDLDALNFVLTNPSLDSALRKSLMGSNFNITTLQRLVETKEVQQAVGYFLQNGKLISQQSQDRVLKILTDVVQTIATGKKSNGEKFTVRDVDSIAERHEFISEIAAKYQKQKKTSEPWTICGVPCKAAIKSKSKKKGTPSTEDQANLIPRGFKLDLPSGKINDVFIELKELDATRRRHAVSVLFRVFFDFTLNSYIERHNIQLPTDRQGRIIDKLSTRLGKVLEHTKVSSLLSEKELKPIEVTLNSRHSFLSPETLNAYVHSEWMNPDPLQLKLSWASIQLFVQRLWESAKAKSVSSTV